MSNIKYPGFWKTADYIRRNYRWIEPCRGTKYLLRITRDLMDHFRYSMIHNGLAWTRAHWYEHIDEYIIEQEEMINATQNYICTLEEYDFLRDQFAEH